METMEERLAAVEHEQAKLERDNAELRQINADLRQQIELHSMVIGGLVNKAMLEAINEKNDKIFKALMDHDKFTNHQLAELREKVEVELDGKVVGLQTEVHQSFTEVRQSFTEVRQRFDLQDTRSETQDQKVDQILLLLKTLTGNSPQEM